MIMARSRDRFGLVLIALCASAAIFASPLRAQEPAVQGPAVQGAWFPVERYFAPLVADPLEVRLAAGLAWTNLFANSDGVRERLPFTINGAREKRTDLQGTVSLGGALPLLRLARSENGGAVLGVQAGVHARFRIEEPSRDYMASDWMVAVPIEIGAGPLATRIRLVHRSSHLGDELMEETGAQRIEYGHEALELLVAYRTGNDTRVYGGGSWVFRSNTAGEWFPGLLEVRDAATIQAGFDGRWHPWGDEAPGLVAGIDWQSAQRTEWRGQFSAAAGVVARGPGGGLRLVVRYFNGSSPAGEFFLTDESFFGIEIVAER